MVYGLVNGEVLTATATSDNSSVNVSYNKGYSPYRLATIGGIDAKTVAATTLYTVPVGKIMIITSVVVKCAAADTVSVACSYSLGGNNPNYDNWKGITASGLDSQGQIRMETVENQVSSAMAAGTVFKLNITTGATATTQTLVVDLFGYLLDM